MKAHIAALKELRSQLRELGNPISDQDMATTLLHSVSGPYESLVGEMEGADSSVKVTAKYVESRLLAREARLKQLADREVTTTGVETMLYANSPSGRSGGGSGSSGGSGATGPAGGASICTHCGRRNHTKEACWNLIGKPPGWVPRPRKTSGKKTAVAATGGQVNMLIATLAESKEHGVGGCAALVNSVPSPSGRSLPQTWISDSGASKHISPNRGWFRDYTPIPSVKVCLGDGHVFEAVGKGNILVQAMVEGKPIRSLLREVLYAPDSHYNLLSVSRLTSVGVTVIYTGDRAVMKTEQNSVLFLGMRGSDGLYHVSMETMQDKPADVGTGPVALPAAVVESAAPVMDSDATKWHNRLGHLNVADLASLDKVVDGFYSTVSAITVSERHCTGCMQGKSQRTAMPKVATTRAAAPLQLVHSDLCGPLSVPTPHGSRYCVTDAI